MMTTNCYEKDSLQPERFWWVHSINLFIAAWWTIPAAVLITFLNEKWFKNEKCFKNEKLFVIHQTYFLYLKHTTYYFIDILRSKALESNQRTRFAHPEIHKKTVSSSESVKAQFKEKVHLLVGIRRYPLHHSIGSLVTQFHYQHFVLFLQDFTIFNGAEVVSPDSQLIGANLQANVLTLKSSLFTSCQFLE